MSERIYNVLFLCTGNTARSILAESILRKDGRRNFRAFSAGSQPKGDGQSVCDQGSRTASITRRTICARRAGRNSRAADAPVMDFVFTVCDNAAGESCPIWPGQPMTAHWGIEDPAAVEGTDIEKEAAFVDGVPLSQESHRHLHQPAARKHRPPVAWDAAARHRPHRRFDRQAGRRPADVRIRSATPTRGRGPRHRALVATVVGSGIMAETLTKDVALALLGNTLPTGAILVVLITILGPDLGRAFQSRGHRWSLR